MKRRIDNFDQWNLMESFKASFTEDPMTSVAATRMLAESFIGHPDFSEDEKLYFHFLAESETTLLDWDTLDEGKLIDKMKEVATKITDKGKEYYQKIKDKIGDEVKGIPDFFNTLKDGVKRLVGYIKEFLNKSVKYIFGSPDTYVNDDVAESSTTETAKEQIEDVAKKSAARLKEESVAIKEIVVGTPKLLNPKKLGDEIKTNLEKVSDDVKDKELEVVKESMTAYTIAAFAEAVKEHSRDEIMEALASIESIDEEDHGHSHFNIPFVTTLTHFLEKFPPFSWLKTFVEYAASHANDTLTYISNMMAKKGAVSKAVEFSVIGTIFALFVEDILKYQVKHAILLFVPPIGWVVSFLGMIASGIWLVHVTATVIDGMEKIEAEMDAAAEKIATAE